MYFVFSFNRKGARKVLGIGKVLDIQAAIQQLPLNTMEPSQRIYRQCHDRIRKRSNLICQEKGIVSERKVNYERGKLKRHSIYTKEGPLKILMQHH